MSNTLIYFACLQLGENEKVQDEVVKHGYENEHIKKHETSGECGQLLLLLQPYGDSFNQTSVVWL